MEPLSPAIQSGFVYRHRQVGGLEDRLFYDGCSVTFVGDHQVWQLVMDLFTLLTTQPSDDKPSCYTRLIFQLTLSRTDDLEFLMLATGTRDLLCTLNKKRFSRRRVL